MSDEINLRDIERRAYLSYHEDGLLDIMITRARVTKIILEDV